MVKYKPTKMPSEAYENFKRKITQIKSALEKHGKKGIKIPFTDGLRFLSQKPLYVYDDELIDYFIKNKRYNL